MDDGDILSWIHNSASYCIIIAIVQSYYQHSRVAQWKRAGPITQRSMDRNHSLLVMFSFCFPKPHHTHTALNYFQHCYLTHILCVCECFSFLLSTTLAFIKTHANTSKTLSTNEPGCFYNWTTHVLQHESYPPAGQIL